MNENLSVSWLAAKDKVLQEVTHAFANVTLENGMSLSQADLEGAYWSDSEFLRAREFDAELEWGDVQKAKLESMASAFSFLDDEGWRFYLPAYLTLCLKSWDSGYPVEVDRLVSNLTPVFEGALIGDRIRRFDKLTHDQHKAVASFLTFVVQYSEEFCREAQLAIDTYWGLKKVNVAH